jgi:uncharacterized protein
LDRLKIQIGALEPGRNPLSLEADLRGLGLDQWLKPCSLLSVTGTVDRFGETITVRGRAGAEIEESCARCLKDFRRPLSFDFLVYSDRQGVDDERTTRELEREGQLVYHDGVTLDLTEAVREAIILSFPIRSVCRDDCRGLCPGCGVDLNTEACLCPKERTDPRWSVLERLKRSDGPAS